MFVARIFLELLEVTTSLKVNFNKSLLVGVNMKDMPL